MTPKQRSELAVQHVRATLRLRVFAKQYLSEAEGAGRKGEATQWRKELVKLEKMIANYGLERYAARS